MPHLDLSQLLAKHFDLVIDSPDGIKKLRELILNLAMKGKLVPQDPDDQPASELLKEIEAEKKKLVKAGKIKAPKPLAPIKPEEIPYDLPKGWEWVRLGEVINDIVGGGTPSKDNIIYWNGEIPWASVKDLNVNIYLENTLDYITDLGLEHSSSNIILKNNIIISTRMGLGKIVLNTINVAINQDLKGLYLSSNIHKMFFFFYYKSLNIVGQGMTVKGIRQEELLHFYYPLPPLSEQKRIVEKIDQLMALCNQMEEIKQKRDKARITLNVSALNRLQSSKTDTEFQSAWQFILDNFNEIYSVKENVLALKKEILSLAMKGKLVPQDPNDQPASELLKEIEAEKKKLFKEGKIKAPKPLAPIKPEEIPYDLPKGWEWVRLGTLCIYLQRGKSPIYSEIKQIPVISQKCIQWDAFKADQVKFIDVNSISKYNEDRLIHTNDLLMNSTGTGTIGRVIVYQNELSSYNKIVADSHVTVIRISLINPSYIFNYLSSPFIQSNIENFASGTTNQIELNTTTIANFLIPLPPLSEQKSIVDKINYLIALYDQIEMGLIELDEKSKNITYSIID